MRIHRLISILVVLGLLALAATMSAIQHTPLGLVSDTVSAQKDNGDTITIAELAEAEQGEGFSKVVASETSAQTDVDLYLDADEVEKRAAAEQSGDTDAVAASRVPVSFKHVPIPLPGGIDHVVAGVSTRNAGHGTRRLHRLGSSYSWRSLILFFSRGLHRSV